MYTYFQFQLMVDGQSGVIGIVEKLPSKDVAAPHSRLGPEPAPIPLHLMAVMIAQALMPKLKRRPVQKQ